MTEKRRDSKGRILQLGEYQEKDGSYTYRYTDPMGKRHKLRSWRLTRADSVPYNKRDTVPLRDLESDLNSQISKGFYPDDTTVTELVERYVITRTGVTDNTRVGYRTVQKILENDEFGQRRISKIKYTDAKLFLIKLQSEGRGYSSIHSIRGVLRPAFQMALEDEVICYNPFDFTLSQILINDSVKREAVSLDVERKFLKFVREDSHFSRYYDGIYILFKTGLRISEFCGLTEADIDFRNQTLTVDHQLMRTRDGRYYIVQPKTSAGKRVLPITDDVCEAFRSILKNRKTPKVEPVIDGKAGFLYLDKNDMPMLALHWEHYFKHICEKYNSIYRVQLPVITPHVCRHTYCTNMAKSGVSVKTLQYLMGHSDISVTMNVYTHFGLEEAQSELAGIKKHKERVS